MSNFKIPIVVNVFIFCFNEEILLPHTINHYKRCLPNCIITIIDNMSNDSSEEISRLKACKVIKFDTGGKMDEFKKIDMANNIWKNYEKGWVIIADMDEWLCVTEKDLLNENNKGSTILKVKGINMIGKSERNDLKDIDLHNLYRGLDNHSESKNMCFNSKYINEINFSIGQHTCDPKGKINFSNITYINKHMEQLGEEWILRKIKARRKRRMKDHSHVNVHYLKSKTKIIDNYKKHLIQGYLITDIIKWNLINFGLLK